MEFRVIVRKGVFDVLDLLSVSGEGVTVKELKKKVSVSGKTLQALKAQGLVEVASKDVVAREVPFKRKRASFWLSDKGKRLLELSGEVDASLLRVTPKQLECLKLLGKGKKHSSDIPEGLKATLQGMVKRGLVKKRIAKEEVKRKIYGRRLVYTITEKGVKAHEALKTIESL